MATTTYHEEQTQRQIQRLRQIMGELPEFAEDFFTGIAQTTAARTRLAYAYDLRIFFDYLCQCHRSLMKKCPQQLTLEDLAEVKAIDIERYLDYLTYYTKPDPENPQKINTYQNDDKGKARKLAAVRKLFKYLYRKEKISADPASLVDTPKIHDKAIVRLDVDEVANLLDEVETGSDLTKRQKAFHKKNQVRDLAIVTLLLGTGMRVSECVGINVKDVNFKDNSVRITRKGGNESILYFGDEVRQSLMALIEERNKNTSIGENEQALFLSNRGSRISVRMVELLVKKYARVSAPLKKISPHKLRSTYGTNLYQETGDIYLVADVLGHADVNTTKKHYAEIEDSRRRQAAKYIKLRKDD